MARLSLQNLTYTSMSPDEAKTFVLKMAAAVHRADANGQLIVFGFRNMVTEPPELTMVQLGSGRKHDKVLFNQSIGELGR